jgi:hypothetical protein
MSLFSFLFSKKATAASSNPSTNVSSVEDVRKSKQDAGEVILNLWYVTNNYYISALLSKAYLASGTDEEMTTFLKQRSRTDYKKAQMHEVPEELKHSIELYGDNGKKTSLHECTHQYLDMMGGYSTLFRDIIVNQPTNGHKFDPSNVLFCRTALLIEKDGSLTPQVN